MTAGPDLPESRGEEKTEYRLDGIQIQTTSHCQGRCIICPYSTSWHAKNPGDMDDRTFEIIVDQIKDIPTGKICPYLENEPLMDPKLFERIRIIRDTCTYGLIEVAIARGRDEVQRRFSIVRSVNTQTVGEQSTVRVQ